MILIHRDNPSLTKTVPEGFSWTTLFFGGLVPLFRGDLKWFILIFLVSIATFGLGHLIFAFIYNKKYMEMLMEKGYQYPTHPTNHQNIQKNDEKKGLAKS